MSKIRYPLLLSVGAHVLLAVLFLSVPLLRNHLYLGALCLAALSVAVGIYARAVRRV
ncbi:MAG: hypothetical protein JWM95_4510 [Gemmatimonadetes bacterium]|nr:hypothetical protein [Gemmatimonadota bacterium]